MVIESFLLSGVRGNSILSELNHFFYSFFAFGLTSIVTLQSCCSIAYDELDRTSEIWYTVNDNESKAYASVLLACEGVNKRS